MYLYILYIWNVIKMKINDRSKKFPFHKKFPTDWYTNRLNMLKTYNYQIIKLNYCIVLPGCISQFCKSNSNFDIQLYFLSFSALRSFRISSTRRSRRNEAAIWKYLKSATSSSESSANSYHTHVNQYFFYENKRKNLLDLVLCVNKCVLFLNIYKIPFMFGQYRNARAEVGNNPKEIFDFI